MIPVAGIRAPELIREEISDLRAYLEGLPGNLRHGEAFDSYRNRLEELRKEMVLSQILKLSVPLNVSSEAAQAFPSHIHGLRRLHDEINRLENYHSRKAERSTWIVSMASALVTAACGIAIGASVNVLSLTASLSGLLTVLGTIVSFLGIKHVVQREERLVVRYSQLAQLVGEAAEPNHKDFRTSEYSESISQRIEQLVSDLAAMERSNLLARGKGAPVSLAPLVQAISKEKN